MYRSPILRKLQSGHIDSLESQELSNGNGAFTEVSGTCSKETVASMSWINHA